MISKHLALACIVGITLGSLDQSRAESPPSCRQIEVCPTRSLASGTAVVLRLSQSPLPARPPELIVHFHGAVDTVRRAMERDAGHETVVVVNMPGLSTAYSKPFRDDPTLFSRLLAEAWHDARESEEPAAWQRITLSCFSAGYGAVREILRSPDDERIDAIVAADSIYAGLESEDPARLVSGVDMEGFLAFARQADAGERVFVIAHSSQPTPYASTTETADYLVAALRLSRTAVPPADADPFPEVSRCEGLGLLVIGHAGESAAAHLHHLRILDRYWAAARHLAQKP